MNAYQRVMKVIHRLNLVRKINISSKSTNIPMHYTQLPILEIIISHDGPTQIEVAERLHVSPPAVASSAKRLENAGLIERRADEADARRNRLYATMQGKKCSEEIRALFNEEDRRTFTGFSEEEIQTLYELLSRMLENVSEGMENRNVFELMEQLVKMKGVSDKDD